VKDKAEHERSLQSQMLEYERTNRTGTDAHAFSVGERKPDDRTKRIAELNDLCRTAMGVAGLVVRTRGIAALPFLNQSVIREKVEKFDDFSEDNNPHGERDFGTFTHNGQRIFWKIDYYDRTLCFGSEDPSDPGQTERVLTIMLASEY
jgi:hypothetical protein